MFSARSVSQADSCPANRIAVSSIILDCKRNWTN
jgi:hypothetical protein